MRFFGGGVGHSSTREASTFFLNDRRPPDRKSPHHEQTQSESGDDLGSDTSIDRNINPGGGSNGAEEDFDSDGQNFDQEDGGSASNSEPGTSDSEVFDFDYQISGSDEESEGEGGLPESDTGSQAWSQGSDGEGPRDSDNPEGADFSVEGLGGVWADGHDGDSESEDLGLGFAPF